VESLDAVEVQSCLLFEPSPHIGSSHAATIVELPNGHLLCAWFAGTHEGHEDVAIWLARHDGDRWLESAKVADVPGVPLWNPVLFRDAHDEVWLFYKVGPTIPSWTGAAIRSSDGGHTWSAPVVFPAGLLGPAKNKPITLSNGDILSPTSSETWRSWACWVEISADGGHNWTKHGPIAVTGYDAPSDQSDPVSAVWDAETRKLRLPKDHAGVIQPSVWEVEPGRLRMVMRSTRLVGAVCMADSNDYGRTWSRVRTTAVANPNSGLDVVCLPDGHIAMVCNPVSEGRTPLSLLVSSDNGESWQRVLDLETKPGEYSYPSVILSERGVLHVVYTHDRTSIKHAIVKV